MLGVVSIVTYVSRDDGYHGNVTHILVYSDEEATAILHLGNAELRDDWSRDHQYSRA